MRFRVTFPKDTPTLFSGETISFYELNRGEDWKKFKALFVEIRKKMFCIVSGTQWWMEEMRVWA